MMDSHGAQKLGFTDYLSIPNDQDHIFLGDQTSSQPCDINTRHETLAHLQKEPQILNLPAGNRHNLSLLGAQRPKRMRSNSDEGSDDSFKELVALLSQRSPDDVRKILTVLKADAKDPSPNNLSTISLTAPQAEDVSSIGASEPFLGLQNQAFQPEILDPTLWYDNTMGAQDWMQPINSTTDSSYDPSIGLDFSFQNFPEYGPARASMPIQGTPHHNPTPRSHVSQPVPFRGATAPSHAAYLLREEMTANPQDLQRGSISSTSSHSSIDTFLTKLDENSGYSTPSSTTSSWYSQSSSPLPISNPLPRRLPPTRTMCSSMSSKRIQHPVSALEGDGNTCLGVRVPCSYPMCSITFSRDADRVRHESVKHSTQGGYICLLHTCSSSCPDNCENKQHKAHPYRNARADKMKDHLHRAHNWTLKQKEIPKAFSKNLKHSRMGWTCGCGIFLGNWHEDEQDIVKHVETCNGEPDQALEVDFKRLSVEDPLVLKKEGSVKSRSSGMSRSTTTSRGSNLSIDKALPPTPLNIGGEKFKAEWL
ncbi:hypothetical protein BGZ60DRAFT_198781 [Tricladium varicosporioides]|nr:hypothetical protein BGZ60DRAFT_198781 [Hymenoscyphus varicosporioides]